jgi:DNA-binding NarL/FixJ family response regulator
MSALLVLHPDAGIRANVERLAKGARLDCLAAAGLDEAREILMSNQSLTLLVLPNRVGEEDGDGLRLIEELRLILHRATLPVACLLSAHDLAAAQQAFRAGATEVFEDSDTSGLRVFIGEIARQGDAFALSGRVLLLEDSPSHAAFVRQLCRDMGLECDHASSVEDGLTLFANGRYQLAVVDIVLDGVKSGLEMVRTVRRTRGLRNQLPVLVMSGYDDAARRIEALRVGASDFLNKPFAAEEFIWRVRKLLQEQARDEDPVAVEHSASRWLHLGLTPRESQVCDALIQGSSDRAISEALGISFWTVRTHIQRVFAKLGVLNRRELIVRYYTRREP